VNQHPQQCAEAAAEAECAALTRGRCAWTSVSLAVHDDERLREQVRTC